MIGTVTLEGQSLPYEGVSQCKAQNYPILLGREDDGGQKISKRLLSVNKRKIWYVSCPSSCS